MIFPAKCSQWNPARIPTALPLIVVLAIMIVAPGWAFSAQGPARTLRNYYNDGRIKTEWHVRQDEKGRPVRHGRLLRYHPNGNLALRAFYRNGKQVGIWGWFDEMGRLYRKARLNGDFEQVLTGEDLDNPATVYRSPQGVKLAEGLLRFDKGHGKWVYFHPDGIQKAEGRFVNGIPDGKWLFQYPNGQISRRVDYKLGILHGPFMEGYANGQERIEGRMDQGLRVGPWNTWFPNGQLESSGQYLQDRREGEWKFWDDKGRLLRRVRYENGKEAEVLPLPKKRLAPRPKVIRNPRALPFRPRIYNDDGREIRLRNP